MPDYIPPIHDAVLLRPASEDKSLSYFRITMQLINGRKRSPRHWHDYFQIWYTLSGEHTQEIEDRQLTLRAGSMAVIPPYTEHRWDTSGSREKPAVLCLRVRRDAELPLCSLGHGAAAWGTLRLPVWHTFSGEAAEKSRRTVESLLEEAEKKSAMSAESVHALVESLLRLYGEAAGVRADPRRLRRERVLMENMEKAAGFITEHHRQDITLDRIAEQLYISRRSLTDGFFRCMGRTVHGYILAERLRSAYHILRTTTCSVEEAAKLCGFANSSHFSAAFKKQFGCTPLHFRKAVSRWQKAYGNAEFMAAIEEMRWFTEPTEQSLINHYTSMSFE